MIKILEHSIGRVSERMLALLVPGVEASAYTCWYIFTACDNGTGCGNQYDKFYYFQCSDGRRRRNVAGCCQTSHG